jgi:hypothetical protein
MVIGPVGEGRIGASARAGREGPPGFLFGAPECGAEPR